MVGKVESCPLEVDPVIPSLEGVSPTVVKVHGLGVLEPRRPTSGRLEEVSASVLHGEAAIKAVRHQGSARCLDSSLLGSHFVRDLEQSCKVIAVTVVDS